MALILIVEDDPAQQRLVQQLLECDGYETVLATSVCTAQAALRRSPFDLVICDVVLPDESGMSLAAEVLAAIRPVPILMMTASGSEDLAVEAMRSGVAGYVPKRQLQNDLRREVRRILAGASLQQRQRDVNRTVALSWQCHESSADPALLRDLSERVAWQLEVVAGYSPVDSQHCGTLLLETCLSLAAQSGTPVRLESRLMRRTAQITIHAAHVAELNQQLPDLERHLPDSGVTLRRSLSEITSGYDICLHQQVTNS